MPLIGTKVAPRHAQRLCLSCGYRGPELQGDSGVFVCPSCGTDLYARPPRSYAELEGLDQADARFGVRRVVRRVRARRAGGWRAFWGRVCSGLAAIVAGVRLRRATPRKHEPAVKLGKL